MRNMNMSILQLPRDGDSYPELLRIEASSQVLAPRQRRRPGFLFLQYAIWAGLSGSLVFHSGQVSTSAFLAMFFFPQVSLSRSPSRRKVMRRTLFFVRTQLFRMQVAAMPIRARMLRLSKQLKPEIVAIKWFWSVRVFS